MKKTLRNSLEKKPLAYDIKLLDEALARCRYTLKHS